MKAFFRGFKYAFKGLHYAFKTQINFKIHTVFACLAIVLGVLLRLSVAEWLWIIASVGLMLITELINTSIEVLVDLVSPEFNPKAGIVKDVSAGAVLVAAFLAVIIGICIFVPKLFHYAS